MRASRNIRLCTKDCLCLFVCPTGATDTEDGQIDKTLCLDGCRACVDACPSHAIHLIPDNYPEPKTKDPELASRMLALLESKGLQEGLASRLADDADSEGAKRLARALSRSIRIVGEDCAREAGYMLPQCEAVRELEESLDL